jgi:hypothetical protein
MRKLAWRMIFCVICIVPASAKDIDYATARIEKRLRPIKITDKIIIDG